MPDTNVVIDLGRSAAILDLFVIPLLLMIVGSAIAYVFLERRVRARKNTRSSTR